jgi:uncharacterized protein YigE (DUF2233 family)
MSKAYIRSIEHLCWFSALSFAVLILATVLFDSFGPAARAERSGLTNASAQASCALPKDAGIALRCINFAGHDYAVADIDLRSHKIIFTTADDHKMHSYPEVDAALRSSGRQPILITNAGIYGTDNLPLGLLITPKGKAHSVARVASRSGNFSWDTAVFEIRNDDRASITPAGDWQENPSAIAATQSGPQLASLNRVNPDLPPSSVSTYSRTAAGIDQSSPSIVHIAVSRDGVTLFELASFMVDILHCREALHLDGSLSALYLPSASDKYVFSDPGERIVTVLSVLKK